MPGARSIIESLRGLPSIVRTVHVRIRVSISMQCHVRTPGAMDPPQSSGYHCTRRDVRQVPSPAELERSPVFQSKCARDRCSSRRVRTGLNSKYMYMTLYVGPEGAPGAVLFGVWVTHLSVGYLS